MIITIEKNNITSLLLLLLCSFVLSLRDMSGCVLVKCHCFLPRQGYKLTTLLFCLSLYQFDASFISVKLIFILAKEPLKNHDGTFLYDPVGSAGLFKAGLRSPRVSAKFEFRYESL